MWLIPIYGMMGAAISTMVAIVLTNLFRTIFIKWKLHLSPFTTKNIWMLVIMLVTLFIGYFIDDLLNTSSITHIFICGSIITLLYWLPVVLFKISPDISQVISNKLNRNK
jgi:O-antigen/teichoic acid export membrane protein